MAGHCNGWNHGSSCDCGWGGRNGEAKIAKSRPAGTRSSWPHVDDFCRATMCPNCHEPVFFVRHNGGSVWFDELGPPWPKHGCFNDYASYKLQADMVEPGRNVFGVVVETEVIEPGRSGRIVVKCSDNNIIDSTFETEWDLVGLIGRLVTIHRETNGGITIYRV